MLRDDEYDCLDSADQAAAVARAKWMASARDPRRRAKQLPPAGDTTWEILLFLAGRGFGKTAAMSNWLWWEGWTTPNMIGHFVAPTLSDVRGTAFEGDAGLLNVVPYECLLGGSIDKAYNKSLHELRLSNGTLFRGFGAVEEAGRLRGPQCHALVGDELREWDKPAGNLELAMNNALFGLRLPYPDGRPARAVFGTTPKPIPFLKRFARRPGLRLVTGSSYENLHNMSATYRSQLLSLDGTLMGRQEIDGAFIDEESDLSIFKRRWMNLWPAGRKLPEFSFLIEVYDTAYEDDDFDLKNMKRDPTASIVLGVFNIAQQFTPEEVKKMGIRMVPGRPRYGVLLCDCWSEMLDFPELLEVARKQHAKKWGEKDRARKADIVLIENKGSGISLRQTLNTYGVPTWPFSPGNQSKTMRAHAASPFIQQGLLFLPESARPDRKGKPRDWVEPFLEQVTAFAGPGSVEHDDFVDCLSSAFIYLSSTGMLDALPIERYVDLEAKLQEDQDEAMRLKGEQDRRRKKNPYGS